MKTKALILCILFSLFSVFTLAQEKPKDCGFCELKTKGETPCEKCIEACKKKCADEKCTDGKCETKKCDKSGSDQKCDKAKKCGKSKKCSGKSDFMCKMFEKMKLLKKMKYGPYINTLALENIIQSGVPVVIADARTGEYDDKTRIPGAISLAPDAGADVIGKAIKSKDTLVITYCGSLQCPASNMLYMHLKKLGYKNVLEYPFGIKGWLSAGKDVEMAK